MRRDIVTTMPRAGYSHTGKRVALTMSGEMFLDPNAIETLLWSSAGVNVSYHGKPAYKGANTLFASKYLPEFKPEFIEREAEVPASMAITNLEPSSKPEAEENDAFSLGPGGKWK